MEIQKSNDSSSLERSVVRMREKLAAIRSLVDAALKVTSPLEDGSCLNLGSTYRSLSASIAAIREFCGPAIAEGSAKSELNTPAGGLDFGAELCSLYRLAFGQYGRLADDFIKYNLVMTASERGSVKALRDLSFNISNRLDQMIESRMKKGGAK